MSEHRGHLLPDTEDISCRGGPIVELRPGMRQRIYRCRDRDVLAGHARLPSGTLRGDALSGWAAAGGKVAGARVPTALAGPPALRPCTG